MLLVDDPDAQIEGSFVHGVLYGLDPNRRGLAEGEIPGEAEPARTGSVPPGYLGPAPPPRDSPHRYLFRLLALDTPLRLDELPSYAQVEAASIGNVVAEARLDGTYQR